jgi:hypothetical protein
MLTLAARAQTTPAVSVLYNFNVIQGGDQPQAALTPGPNGVYYGTTDVGGASGNGTVFILMPPAARQSGWSQKVIRRNSLSSDPPTNGATAWSETILYNFAGAPDGSFPNGGLKISRKSRLRRCYVMADGSPHLLSSSRRQLPGDRLATAFVRVKIGDVAVGDAQAPPRSEGRCIPLLQIYRMSTQTDRLLV